MAKTKTELLRAAAVILTQIVGTEPAGPFDYRTIRHADWEQAKAWLQEEISEDGDSSSQQSEELPTDDRWFAAYLKGIEAFGRISAVNPGMMATMTAMEACKLFAKDVADDALAAAREQAKEVRA